ncbi:MAG: hypothetical protein ACRCXZ_09120 [Patescibacteria group bacterium]
MKKTHLFLILATILTLAIGGFFVSKYFEGQKKSNNPITFNTTKSNLKKIDNKNSKCNINKEQTSYFGDSGERLEWVNLENSFVEFETPEMKKITKDVFKNSLDTLLNNQIYGYTDVNGYYQTSAINLFSYPKEKDSKDCIIVNNAGLLLDNEPKLEITNAEKQKSILYINDNKQSLGFETIAKSGNYYIFRDSGFLKINFEKYSLLKDECKKEGKTEKSLLECTAKKLYSLAEVKMELDKILNNIQTKFEIELKKI